MIDPHLIESAHCLARIIHRRVSGARKPEADGALREPAETTANRCEGLHSVRNPPFVLRFASRTLQFVNNPGQGAGSARWADIGAGERMARPGKKQPKLLPHMVQPQADGAPQPFAIEFHPAGGMELSQLAAQGRGGGRIGAQVAHVLPWVVRHAEAELLEL